MRTRDSEYRQVARAAIGFRPEFLDFARGIRVGNLKDNERITRLLKLELEHRFRQTFVTLRWGRGVHWQWIGFLPKANRTAKPVSSSVNFGCSKFFLMIDTEDRLFKCGLQIERGLLHDEGAYGNILAPDWDWNRLVKSLRAGGPMEREMRRLVIREGFRIHAGAFGAAAPAFNRSNPPAAAAVRRLLASAPGDEWAGFQLYYPMEEPEVRHATGLDLYESILAVFDEVTPAMNLCMQIRLEKAPPAPAALP